MPTDEIKIIKESALIFDRAPLGGGTYGNIWKASIKRKPSVSVIAKYPNGGSNNQGTTYEGMLNSIVRELSLLSKLSSNFIIKIFGFVPTKCGIIMEYAVSGDLSTYLGRQFGWIENKKLILLDVARGLSYLHQSNVAHRDLKNTNILLDGQLRAKISDFGVSSLQTLTNMSTIANRRGTYNWMAPEIFTRRGDRRPVREYYPDDMWAFGLMVASMFSNNEPFAGAIARNELLDQYGDYRGIDFKRFYDTNHSEPDIFNAHSLFGQDMPNTVRDRNGERSIREFINRVFSPCVKRVPTQRMTAEQAVTTIQEIAPNLVQQGEPSPCQNPFDNIAAPPVANPKPAPSAIVQPPVAKPKPAPFGYTPPTAVQPLTFAYTPPTATFLPTIALPDDTTTMEIPQRQAGFYTPRGGHRLSIQPSDCSCVNSFSWNGSDLPSRFLFFCNDGHGHDMTVQQEEVEIYTVTTPNYGDDEDIVYYYPNCRMM